MQKLHSDISLPLPLITPRMFWFVICLIEWIAFVIFQLMLKTRYIQAGSGSLVDNWNASSFVGFLVLNLLLYTGLIGLYRSRRKQLKSEVQTFLAHIDESEIIDNVYQTLSNDNETQHLVKRMRDYCQVEEWQNAYDLLDKENLHNKLLAYGEAHLLLELCQPLLVNNVQFSPIQQADIYNVAGIASRQIGKLPEAFEYFQQALQQANGMNEHDCQVISTALSSQGLIYGQMGQLQNAITSQMRALFAIQETKNKKSEATILISLDHLYYGLHKNRRAFEFYRYALGIAYELADQETTVNSLSYIAKIYFRVQYDRKAFKCCELAMNVVNEIGYSKGKATILNNLADICEKLHLPSEAIRCYGYALKINDSVNGYRNRGMTLYNTGIKCWRLGQQNEAIKCLIESLDIHKSLELIETEVIILYKLGEIYATQEQFEVSLACILLANNFPVDNPHVVANGKRTLSFLKGKLDDRQFSQLLAQVEPRAQQIVDEALINPLP